MLFPTLCSLPCCLLQDAVPRVFLSDLVETEAFVGHGSFGKAGNLGCVSTVCSVLIVRWLVRNIARAEAFDCVAGTTRVLRDASSFLASSPLAACRHTHLALRWEPSLRVPSAAPCSYAAMQLCSYAAMQLCAHLAVCAVCAGCAGCAGCAS